MPTLTQVGEWFLMLFGDSKVASSALNTWQAALLVEARARTGVVWTMSNVAVGGRTVATTLAAHTAALATMPAASPSPGVIALCNLGVNDISLGLPAEAAWEADYLSILDAIRAKWPTVTIYVMRPWLVGHEADCDTVAVRVGHLIAARPAFLRLGPDERVWLKGADLGATMTYDGTHYSVAGNTAATAQWAQAVWPI